MAFPESPSNNQRYTFRGKVYQYNSSRGVWRTVAGIDIEQTDLISNTSLNSTLSSYWPSANVITYVGSAGGGVTTYANNAALPTSGFSAGDLAFSSANNTLFFNTGSGWYKIALINQTPTITTSSNSLYIDYSSLYDLTYTLSDPEGLPVTIVSVSNSGISNTDIATVTHTSANNTISITTGTSFLSNGTITITATDGINTAIKNVNLSIFNRVSYQFDGSDYISSTIPTAIGTGEFTIEMWIYRTSASTDESIIVMGNAGSGGFGLAVVGQKIRVRNGATTLYNAGSDLAQNTWYHVALTRDSSNNLRTFLNGVLLDTRSNTFDATTTTLNVGTYQNSGSYMFTGLFHDLRISNTARYTDNFTPSTELSTIDGNVIAYGLRADSADVFNSSGTSIVDSITSIANSSTLPT